MIENARVLGANGIICMRFYLGDGPEPDRDRGLRDGGRLGPPPALTRTGPAGGVIIGLVVVALVVGLGPVASLFLRRHGSRPGPKPSWQATDEVFKDPTTDRTMRVWLDQAGQRHYVPEQQG